MSLLILLPYGPISTPPVVQNTDWLLTSAVYPVGWAMYPLNNPLDDYIILGDYDSLYATPTLSTYSKLGIFKSGIQILRSPAPVSFSIFGVSLDASGNICTSGYFANDVDTGNRYCLMQLSPAGVLQWSKQTGDGINERTASKAKMHRSSGTAYYSFGQQVAGPSDAFSITTIGAIDSSGQVLWTNNIQCSTTAYSSGYALQGTEAAAVDQTNGDSAVVTQLAITNLDMSYHTYIWLARFNSSGIKQWERAFTAPTPNSSGPAVEIDSAGNTYLVYVSDQSYAGNGVLSTVVEKINVSGTVVWTKHLTSNNTLCDAGGMTTVACDGPNVYVGRSWDNSLGQTIEGSLTKLDSNGNVLYVRSISGYSLVTGATALHVLLQVPGLVSHDLVAYPADGSKFGTYDGVTIANTTVISGSITSPANVTLQMNIDTTLTAFTTVSDTTSAFTDPGHSTIPLV